MIKPLGDPVPVDSMSFLDQVGGMLGPMAARMYFHLFQQVKVGKPKGSGGQANSLLIEFRCDIFLGENDMTYS